MQDIQRTRFVAANYSNLQGLKGVPLGLLLILVVLWANGQTGRATNLAIPIGLALGMVLLVGGIQHYYQSHYGQIEKKPYQKRMEIILGVLGGGIGLSAYLMDISLRLPFSAIGLVFAGAVLLEYARMQWYAPGHYLLPGTLVFFLVMLGVSILPLLGAGEWWKQLGFKTQLYGVLAVAGVITILSGLVGHWFFVRQLPGGEQ